MEGPFSPRVVERGPRWFFGRRHCSAEGCARGILVRLHKPGKFTDLVPWDMTPVGAVTIGVVQGLPEEDTYIARDVFQADGWPDGIRGGGTGGAGFDTQHE